MPVLSGKVIAINVKGQGRGAAQLLFSVSDGRRKMSFVARAKPRRKDDAKSGHEPQVFSGMAALLSAAYFAKEDVTVEYKTRPGETPDVVSVEVPVVQVGKARKAASRPRRR